MRTIFQSKDMIKQVELFEWPSYMCLKGNLYKLEMSLWIAKLWWNSNDKQKNTTYGCEY